MSYGWKYTYHDTHLGQKRGRHSGNLKVLLMGRQWKVACLDTLVLQMNVISCKCDFQFIQTLECRGDADKGWVLSPITDKYGFRNLHKYDLRFIQIEGTLWQVAYLGAGAPQGCSGCRSLQSLPISETSGKVWSKSAAWTTFCLHPSPSHSISFGIFHQKCTLFFLLGSSVVVY